MLEVAGEGGGLEGWRAGGLVVVVAGVVAG